MIILLMWCLKPHEVSNSLQVWTAFGLVLQCFLCSHGGFGRQMVTSVENTRCSSSTNFVWKFLLPWARHRSRSFCSSPLIKLIYSSSIFVVMRNVILFSDLIVCQLQTEELDIMAIIYWLNFHELQEMKGHEFWVSEVTLILKDWFRTRTSDLYKLFPKICAKFCWQRHFEKLTFLFPSWNRFGFYL